MPSLCQYPVLNLFPVTISPPLSAAYAVAEGARPVNLKAPSQIAHGQDWSGPVTLKDEMRSFQFSEPDRLAFWLPREG